MRYISNWKRAIIIVVGILLLVGGTTMFFLKHFDDKGKLLELVSLKENHVFLELGTALNSDVSTYLDCSSGDIDLGLAVLNTSNISQELGVYTAYIHLQDSKLKFFVEVVDTTPPLLELKADEISIKPGMKIYAWDCIESWEEHSGTIDIYFQDYGAERKDFLMYDDIGVYEVFVCGEDRSGNIAYQPFAIHVAN